MLKIIVGALAVIGAITVIVAIAGVYKFNFTDGGDIMPPIGGEPQQIGCTMEAKMCPDGSAVGRSGPNCTFAPCPEVPASDERISVTSPATGSSVKSPLVIRGEARGNWYFEGSFPVLLVAENGMPLVSGVATAEGEWMTEEIVPFAATLEFVVQAGITKGSLILSRDNPSGLPEHDAKVMIPVKF